jgi:hypothetical protein
MCVEPNETKAGSDCAAGLPSATETEVEDQGGWLNSIASMKSLMSRLNGASLGQPKKEEGEDEEWLSSATNKLTKLVGEASEQLTTVSGGWIASLTGRDTTNMKAIEGAEEESSSKAPMVAWELPNLDRVKQDLPLAWSTIRLYWEKLLFGKNQDESTYVTALNPTDSSGADGPSVDEPSNQDQHGDEKFSNDTSRPADAIVDAAVQCSVDDTSVHKQKDDVYEEVGVNEGEAKTEESCEPCPHKNGVLPPEEQALAVQKAEKQGETKVDETSS